MLLMFIMRYQENHEKCCQKCCQKLTWYNQKRISGQDEGLVGKMTWRVGNPKILINNFITIKVMVLWGSRNFAG